MNTANDSLNLAIRYHQTGNLRQAEQLYRQILQADATNVNALHLLGLIALQVGNTDAAIHCIGQAVQLVPEFPEAYVNLGLALRQQGKSSEAVECWRQALRLKPDYAEAHHHLAGLLRDQGQLEEAKASWQQAIRCKPDYTEAHHGLANVWMELGKLDNAVAAYQQVVRFDPKSFRALNNLGLALNSQGKFDEAVAFLQEAVWLKPDYTHAHNNLGNALVSLGKRDEALACYNRVLQLEPRFAAAYNNRGKVFLEQECPDQAAAQFQQALSLQPDFVEALLNLGNAFLELGKLEQAIAKYYEVLSLNPGLAMGYNNLGKVFLEQGKLDDSVAILRQAIDVEPEFIEAYKNLGLVLQEQGKIHEAVASIQRAVQLDPNYADGHKTLGMALLLAGDWEQGWPEYEWRWKTDEFAPPPFNQPVWDGTSLEGRVILLHTEQGFGDALQFVRFAQHVKQRRGTVLLTCQPALLPLLANCPGVDQFIAQGNPLPMFDVHAPLLSLPRILGITMQSVSKDTPYLFADPELVEHWRPQFDRRKTFNIGIAWQGNPKYRGDRHRSIPLLHFAPLARLDGIQLVCLQRGLGTEQLAPLSQAVPVAVLSNELDAAAGPFMDTAAIMKNLDLVVTSDTAVAHLAGGLGVRVWLALPFAPDWRWLLHRDDSPWYPTMRLFRQPEPGNWPAVFERMAAELRNVRLEQTSLKSESPPTVLDNGSF